MQGKGRFFDTKNLYGWSETRATAFALKFTTGKRGQVIPRYNYFPRVKRRRLRSATSATYISEIAYFEDRVI